MTSLGVLALVMALVLVAGLGIHRWTNRDQSLDRGARIDRALAQATDECPGDPYQVTISRSSLVAFCTVDGQVRSYLWERGKVRRTAPEPSLPIDRTFPITLVNTTVAANHLAAAPADTITWVAQQDGTCRILITRGATTTEVDEDLKPIP